jgi:hypothetical protein
VKSRSIVASPRSQRLNIKNNSYHICDFQSVVRMSQTEINILHHYTFLSSHVFPWKMTESLNWLPFNLVPRVPVFKGSGARGRTLANSDCQVTKWSKNLGVFVDLAFFSNGITGGKTHNKKYFTNTSFYQSHLFN